MSFVDRDRMEELFYAGLSDAQISALFISENRGIMKMSPRTVRRRRLDLGLVRRQPLHEAAVDTLVSHAVAEIGTEAGRSYVKGHMFASGYPLIGERRIGASLKRLYPDYHSQRLHGVSRRTNPMRYRADYFGDKLHLDQNEKAAMYGLTYVAAIDGYSGYILKCVTMPVKNPMLIYDVVFRPIVCEYGVWNTMVTDRGREFNLSLAVQDSLAEFRRKTDVVPIRQVRSTLNNRIERFWVELNSRVTYPIKTVLINMEEIGQLDIANPVHRFCCSVAARQVAEVGLARHVNARNHHYIAGRGIPAILKADNTAAHIDAHLVPAAAEAAHDYRRAGGSVSSHATFGQDPLVNRPDLQGARADRLSRHDVADIFTSCLHRQQAGLTDYICDYIETTTILSQFL